ncbi:hypothetical protein BDP27DRAFT_1323752 [Rhodocollybia butyracea]|uniref:Uncharacterized protein n=1 Tax=Rhodocollybia butyracea TaxID=206335 RepID=A0A9P5PWC3_9AGAR|nr:hypothetical protein BDP27DRAFT_1323752 [Rhodocollybia butyracea]
MINTLHTFPSQKLNSKSVSRYLSTPNISLSVLIFSYCLARSKISSASFSHHGQLNKNSCSRPRFKKTPSYLRRSQGPPAMTANVDNHFLQRTAFHNHFCECFTLPVVHCITNNVVFGFMDHDVLQIRKESRVRSQHLLQYPHPCKICFAQIQGFQFWNHTQELLQLLFAKPRTCQLESFQRKPRTMFPSVGDPKFTRR